MRVPTNQTFSSIDLLRGVAATAVMLFHAYGFFLRGTSGWLPANLVFGQGDLGVLLFFIISGFCIHLPNAGSKNALNVRAFAVRRFMRIYPLYIASVLMCSLLLVVQGRLSGVPTQYTAWDFWGHFIFYYHFSSPANGSMGVSGVLWSVAAEVHFYILYVVLLSQIRRFGFGRCAIAGLLIDIIYRMVWVELGLSAEGHWRFFRPEFFAITRFGEWLLGAWIAETVIHSEVHRMPRPIGVNLCLPGGLTLLGIIILGRHCHQTYVLALSSVMGSMAFGLIILFLVLYEQRTRHARRRLRLGVPGRWLGERSYSIYLVHFPIIASIGTAYCSLAGVKDKQTMGGTLPWMGVTFVGVVAALVVAELAFRLIERPSHELGRSLAKHSSKSGARTPPAVPTVA